MKKKTEREKKIIEIAQTLKYKRSEIADMVGVKRGVIDYVLNKYGVASSAIYQAKIDDTSVSVTVSKENVLSLVKKYLSIHFPSFDYIETERDPGDVLSKKKIKIRKIPRKDVLIYINVDNQNVEWGFFSMKNIS